MPAEDIKMRNISSASNLRGEFGVDELHENAAINIMNVGLSMV